MTALEKEINKKIDDRSKDETFKADIAKAVEESEGYEEIKDAALITLKIPKYLCENAKINKTNNSIKILKINFGIPCIFGLFKIKQEVRKTGT